MNRRGFLSLIAKSAPAALVLPELILPKRTFFLPPTDGWSLDQCAAVLALHQNDEISYAAIGYSPEQVVALMQRARLMAPIYSWAIPYNENAHWNHRS
jgi:hypothetical protein